MIALLAALWFWPWAPKPTPVPPPRHDPPQIIRVELSKTDMGAGDHVTGEVVTSANVKTVKAIIIGQTITLTRSRAGHFPIAFSVPTPLPVFFKGDQDVEFIAFNTSGEKVTRTISFHVH
jgi:hypothetical protein